MSHFSGIEGVYTICGLGGTEEIYALGQPSLRKIGSVWYLAFLKTDYNDYGTTFHLTVYNSTDGINWSDTGLSHPDTEQYYGHSDPCILADSSGTPYVVAPYVICELTEEEYPIYKEVEYGVVVWKYTDGSWSPSYQETFDPDYAFQAIGAFDNNNVLQIMYVTEPRKSSDYQLHSVYWSDGFFLNDTIIDSAYYKIIGMFTESTGASAILTSPDLNIYISYFSGGAWGGLSSIGTADFSNICATKDAITGDIIIATIGDISGTTIIKGSGSSWSSENISSSLNSQSTISCSSYNGYISVVCGYGYETSSTLEHYWYNSEGWSSSIFLYSPDEIMPYMALWDDGTKILLTFNASAQYIYGMIGDESSVPGGGEEPWGEEPDWNEPPPAAETGTPTSNPMQVRLGDNFKRVKRWYRVTKTTGPVILTKASSTYYKKWDYFKRVRI